MIRTLTLVVLLTLAIHASAFTQPAASDANDLLLDATFVPCGDSTESLFVFEDGRVIYAWHDQGLIFNLSASLLDDLKNTASSTESYVETNLLDSCTTAGVILKDHRYLLINTKRPALQTRELELRLDRLRKFARRKLGSSLERLTEKAETAPDTTLQSEPMAAAEELRRSIYPSPVAQEWRCRGGVIVQALVGIDGRVRQAFIESSRVRGKCASLLGMCALRAVLLTPFSPAAKSDGKPATAWIRIEVNFGK